MAQIIQTPFNPKRCNLAAIQSGGSQANTVLANGEIWFVDTTNAEKGTKGYGHYDAYIVGDGTKKASALEVNPIDDMSAFATKQELAAKQDVINDLATIRSGAAAGATAYQKPSGGIPASDLTSAVQTSLGKADAAAPQSTTYTKTEVDAALALKQTSSQLATVNGSDITHGGNVTIVAAEGQTITIDAAPTAGSNNAVSSGGVWQQYNGIIKHESVSVAASSKLQKFIECSNPVRFRLVVTSGTPSFTSYAVWAGTSSTALGTQILSGLLPNVVYSTRYGSTYTGITIRTANITSACSFRIEILDPDSNVETISGLENHRVVSSIYDIMEASPASSRLSNFFACAGALRVTVTPIAGTPSGSVYRLYYGTAEAKTDMVAIGDTPYGQTVEVYLPYDSAYTGITIYTPTKNTSLVTYRILIEQLDTEEERMNHRERFLCIGDSLTAFNGQNSVGTGAGRSGMRYSDFMQLIRPGISVANIGIGGTRIAQRTETLPDSPADNSHAYAALDMVNLVEAVCSGDFHIQDAAVEYLNNSAATNAIARAKLVDISNIDIVTILGGTNDWSGGQTLGEVGSSLKTTTLGALNTIISTLLSANPRLRIYVLLPPVRYVGSTYTSEYWCDTYKNANNQTLLEFCESIESVCAVNYMPVIDLHRTLGWNEQNFWTFFVTGDGTHPIAGFERIADKIIHDIF